MKHTPTLFVCAAVIIALVLSGCTFLAKSKDSRLRAFDPTAAVSVKTISRAELREAAGRGDLTSKLRTVQVFASGSQDVPEYRLFGIHPGSVYEKLGLMDGDVLLSCEGRYLVAGELLQQYVSLLPQEKQATIEFRRGYKVYHHKYIIQ